LARKILIVENSTDDREIMRITLNEMGRKEELEFAPSGAVALQCLREWQELPSLIFLDLKFPGMSGIDILRQIKADECFDDIPVVVVSGSSNPEEEKEVINAGADGFIFKNIDLEKFSFDINGVLQRFLEC